MTEDLRRPRSLTYVALFVVVAASLMLEIALTRVFSVVMWYHFAFVAISLALFGLTAGALVVHFLPTWFTVERAKVQMWRFSVAFGVATAICFMTVLTIPFLPERSAVAIWSVAVTCVLLAIPFTLLGVVVCIALTRFPDRVSRLYAADLVGAGVGCVALVVAMNWFDAPSLVIAIGGLACVGGLLFAIDARSRSGQVWASIAAVVLLLAGVGNAALAANGDAFVKILWAKEEREQAFLHERWNVFSRVTVDGNEEDLHEPQGNGISPNLPQELRDRHIADLNVVIDATAATAIIGNGLDPATTEYLRWDISNLAYHARPDGDVAVVGVGGGRDVLSALQFGANSVTGIELNGTILELVNDELGDFSGHVDEDPRVTYVNDEARSYLTRTDDTYDVLQISLVDTWAATQAGAFALSENALYTTDAWNTFLDRLEPGGMLTVSRWYSLVGNEPYETFRTVVLAAEVLDQRGVENPRDHILVFEGPPIFGLASVATVIVSEDPLSDEDLAVIEGTAEEMGFRTILSPSVAVDPRWEAITAPGGPGPALGEFPVDVSAPTDDRPFFFQMVGLSDVLRGEGLRSDNHIYRAVWVLTLLSATVLAMAALCIGLPLALDARNARRRGERLPPGMAPFYLFFAAIGLAFLMVEISQLQRLNVYLGHPTYAITVVLFTVLIFSGLGSMISERFVAGGRSRAALIPFGVLLAMLGVFGFVAPRLVDATAGETTPVRIAVSMAMLAPVALCMGMPFPIGMSLASRIEGAPTAHFWGINGAMSVVASVLAASVALFYGITASFLVGVVAYVVAAAAILWSRRGRPEAATPTVPTTAGARPSSA